MSKLFSSRNRWRLRILLALLVVIGAVAFGTAGFSIVEGWNLVDSLFMTVTTLTTVGYGEVHPLTSSGRIFAVILMLVGVSAVAFAFSTLLQTIFRFELLAAMGVRRRYREMSKLENHFIICGAGRMGTHIIKDVQETVEKFVVIEKDAARATRLIEQGVQYVINADATLEEVLHQAGVERARALVCCLSEDADNVYTVLVARDLNPKLHIIARAVEEQAEARILRAGANQVVAPMLIGARRMAFAMRKPDVADLLDSLSTSGLDLQAERVQLESASVLAGQKLKFAHLKSGLNVVVVSVERSNGEIVFNPPGDFVFEAGDVLAAIGSEETLLRLRMHASGDEAVAKHTVTVN
jgi:voltage-gated potassium channel